MNDEVRTVTVRYPAGHSRTSDWKKAEMFCPNCGKTGVWYEDDEGDYYLGKEYVCLDCECNFSIQGPDRANEVTKLSIDGLREQGNRNAPTD